MTHDWKGNIRELENSIQRAMLSMTGDKIESADLSFLKKYISFNPKRYNGKESLESYVSSLVEKIEREIIVNTLEESGWNRRETSEKLKIGRRTLFTKMKRYGLLGEPQKEQP